MTPPIILFARRGLESLRDISRRMLHCIPNGHTISENTVEMARQCSDIEDNGAMHRMPRVPDRLDDAGGAGCILVDDY